jgi:hypothetical protein
MGVRGFMEGVGESEPLLVTGRFAGDFSIGIRVGRALERCI